MGLFGKKREKIIEDKESILKKELETGIEKLQNEFRVKKEENDNIEERLKIVKEEYDATISNLMAIKKELNQKKLELDVAQREHKSILEKIQGLDQIKDERKESEFIKTEGRLAKIKKELKEMTKEHEKIKENLAQEQSDLHNTQKQHIDIKKELEEANSRLYNAKEELDKKDQFQDTSVLTLKEKEFIEGQTNDKSSAGVIEAASAVVGSLKSKLGTTQKELDTVQNLLEKEREAHAETRKELNRLKESQS